MGMVRGLCALSILLVVSGCAKKVKEEAPSPAIVQYHREKAVEAGAHIASVDLDRALRWEAVIKRSFDEAMDVCRPFLDGRDERSNARRKWPAALMITGVVAGSVVVPALAAGNAAANAGWIAGVGGLSGGAIATSKVLESSGLSGAADAEDRNRVAKIVREQAAIAFDPSRDVDARMAATMRVKAECTAPDIHVPKISQG